MHTFAYFICIDYMLELEGMTEPGREHIIYIFYIFKRLISFPL